MIDKILILPVKKAKIIFEIKNFICSSKKKTFFVCETKKRLSSLKTKKSFSTKCLLKL